MTAFALWVITARKRIAKHPVYRRAAHATTCPDCGALVLSGIDEDVCGLDVLADPNPVGTTGRALAVLTRRRLMTYGFDGRLYRVDSRAAMWTSAQLLPEHVCWVDLPSEPSRRTLPDPDPTAEPPF